MLSLRSIKSYCVAGVTEWPTGVSRTDFPMDGSIVAVQRIPTRSSSSELSKPSANETEAPQSRIRRWMRQGR